MTLTARQREAATELMRQQWTAEQIRAMTPTERSYAVQFCHETLVAMRHRDWEMALTRAMQD